MARLVVVAPGRGTYNRKELNYLSRFEDHPRAAERQQLVARADALRAAQNQPTSSEMDRAEAYSPRIHLPGENASALIYTCSAADFLMISPEHEICAVLGNSMGWYTTLFTGGAVTFEEGFRLVETMAQFQRNNIQGGQIIYPLVDSNWQRDEAAIAAVESQLSQRAEDPEGWCGISIHLGGFVVLAGTDQGVSSLLKELPKIRLGVTDYPFQLPRHAAFHTHLMQDASNHGLYHLSDLQTHQPKRLMIDGRGYSWRPQQSTLKDLQDYTLVHQVKEAYDLTTAVRVALREHNPDHLVLLGPGETLGGALSQVMVAEGWRGMKAKKAFKAAQRSEAPPLIAMNRPEQALHVI